MFTITTSISILYVTHKVIQNEIGLSLHFLFAVICNKMQKCIFPFYKFILETIRCEFTKKMQQ